MNIDKTKPVLTVTSPADGSIASSSTQAITGTVADSLSGVASVNCNGTNAPLSSGSFSCNISFSVGVNLIVVRATDAAGNVAGSNFHVSLPGTLPAPQSLEITPATANLGVGQTLSFSAVDELSRPRSDATWTISDTTIATVSADSSPLLTAVAVGQATLTATAQGVSAQIQVNVVAGADVSLPPGTIIWSNPTTPGFATTQIVQAEPVDGGPDLYSVEVNSDTRDTIVRALTGSGQRLWSRTFPGTRASAMADGNGGILVSYASQTCCTTPLVDVDAQTGATIWENDSIYLGSRPSAGSQAVAPDRTVLVTDFSGAGSYALDPATGASSKLLPSNMPQGLARFGDLGKPPCGPVHTLTDSTPSAGPWDALGPSVAADGSIFQVVSTRDITTDWCLGQAPTSFTSKMYLSKTAPDGSATFTLFNTESELLHDDWPFPRFVANPQCLTCDPVGMYPPNQLPPFNQFFRVVPDGQGGAFVPWWRDRGYPNYEAHLTHISGSAVSDAILPLTYQITAIPFSNDPCPFPYFRPGISCIADFRLVLGENGVLFATDLKSVIALDAATMSPLWTHSTPAGMDLVAATADGGVTINDFQQGLIALDTNGNVAAPSRQTSTAIPWALGYWMGDLGGTFGKFAGSSTKLALLWPVPDGDPQGHKLTPKPRIAHFIPVNQTALGISPESAMQGIKASLGPEIARHDEVLGPAATVQKFLDTLSKPLSAVGFIGHSIFAGNGETQPFYSVGLSFYEGQVLVLQPNSNPPFPVPTYVNSVTVSKIETQARVVFIGACFIGPSFQALWNIHDGTKGQALLVPTDPQSEADLGHAVFAWTRILDDMILQRMTVYEAVNETNAFILGKIDVNGHAITEQWQVIGDHSVKIK